MHTWCSVFLVYLFIYHLSHSYIICKRIQSSKREFTKSTVCGSPVCHHIADTIKKALNESEEPCNNFYKFACGGWIKTQEIPKSEFEFSPMVFLKREIEDKIRPLLEEKPDSNENTAFFKAQVFYKSCMDNETLDALGAKPALDYITELGGWSICNNEEWKKKSQQWDVYNVLKKVQGKFFPLPQSPNIQPFFKVQIIVDSRNLTKHQIQIARSGLGLKKKSYFTNDQLSKHYVELMVLVAKLLGFTCNETDPENNVTAQMYSIFQFEKGIAEIIEKNDKLTNLIELQAKVPNFDWKNYLNSILPDSYRLSQNEQILAPDADYLISVTNLINVTDKRLLSRYILWHMLNDKFDFLSRGFKDANAQYYKNVFGVKEAPEQWRTCIRLTNKNIGLPLDAKYIQKYFKDETITKIKEMFDKFKKVFKTQSLDQKWLDQITRNHINKKVDAMIAKIGYPSYLKDINYINWRYENLTFDKSTPFLNKLKIDSFNRYQLFKKLNYPINKTEWDDQPQDVKAVYKQISNQIVITASILQPPIFQVGKVPSSLNYGSIGSIIGHELIHGFDNKALGKRLLSSNSSEQFLNKSICFEKQFSKFKVGNETLNGTLLLREIIADNEGSKLSYAAYKDYLNNNRDIVLPKLNYTNEQLFFIGFAQGFCIKSTPEAERYGTLFNHPPWDLRIIGTLSNSEDFAKVFRCREKAKGKKRFYMDPLNKCGIW